MIFSLIIAFAWFMDLRITELCALLSRAIRWALGCVNPTHRPQGGRSRDLGLISYTTSAFCNNYDLLCVRKII